MLLMDRPAYLRARDRWARRQKAG